MKAFLVLILMSWMPLSHSQETSEDTRKNDRGELKVILSDIQNALNTFNMDALLMPLSDSVTISFMTTEVVVGKTQIKEYYSKMFENEDSPLSKYTTQATIDAPARFHGDTAVAHGRAQDVYTLKDGGTYQFNTRWTATAIKDSGKWEVLSINFSVDTFDNIVIEELKKNLWMFTILAFFSGAIICFMFVRIRK